MFPNDAGMRLSDYALQFIDMLKPQFYAGLSSQRAEFGSGRQGLCDE